MQRYGLNQVVLTMHRGSEVIDDSELLPARIQPRFHAASTPAVKVVRGASKRSRRASTLPLLPSQDSCLYELRAEICAKGFFTRLKSGLLNTIAGLPLPGSTNE